MKPTKAISQILGGNLRQYFMVAVLVGVIVIFQLVTGLKQPHSSLLTALVHGKMISPTNMQNLLNGNSYVLVIAIGMLFVIITGQIDLAPGSVAAVVGIVMAMAITQRNPDGTFATSPWWWIGIIVGVAVALAVAVAVGRTLERHRHMKRAPALVIGLVAGLLVGGAVALGLASAINAFGIPWWGGVLIGLGAGAAIGAWQGAWLAYIGVPGFITTLAGQMLFRGVNQWIGQARSIPVPKPIQYIGGGYLPDWGPHWGPSVDGSGLNNSTVLLGVIAILVIATLEFRQRAKLSRAAMDVPPLWTSVVRLVLLALVMGYLTFLFGSGPKGTSFPITGCILVAIVLTYNFIATRTTLGRGVYAVGGNRIAAGLTGIDTKKIYFLAMANVSFLAGLAAIMFVGRSRSTGPADGTGWELDAIAAVFIGGAAVSGGVGTVFGSIIGGLVMASLNNGLYLMGIGSDKQKMIKGLVLLVAVAIDLYSKSQGRPSIIGTVQRNLQQRRKKPDLGSTTTVATAGTASN
ncbi:MAG: sugar ABC transporter permease [Actinomycetia bacterium]|nr:sugar ABC transporter permease [Actinomycetes bacterium]